METIYWYRFRDYQGKPYLEEIPVVRFTDKGAWLNHDGKEKFVLEYPGRKRLAHPNKRDAMASFLARKRRQLILLRAQIGHVELAQKSMQESLRRLDAGEDEPCTTNHNLNPIHFNI